MTQRQSNPSGKSVSRQRSGVARARWDERGPRGNDERRPSATRSLVARRRRAVAPDRKSPRPPHRSPQTDSSRPEVRRACRTPRPPEPPLPVRQRPAARRAYEGVLRPLRRRPRVPEAPRAGDRSPRPRMPRRRVRPRCALPRTPRCCRTGSAPREVRASRAETALRCCWSQALRRRARLSGLPSPPGRGPSVPHLQIFSAKSWRFPSSRSGSISL
jgi:hypothetical protein